MRHFALSTLGEFRNGVNFTAASKGGGTRLVNVKDIFRSGAFLNLNGLDTVDLSAVRNLDRYSVQDGDIFFVRSSVKRDGIAWVSLATASAPNAVHCGFVIRFRLTSDAIDPTFLIYQLRSWECRQRLMNVASGAAITNISQGALGEFEVRVPPKAQQRRIASILSAYDDLIKNNTRRIAILEEMARRLYEEWFVRFRFPGYEESATTGGLPTGWSRTTLGSITTKIGSGATPRGGKSAYIDSGVTLIRSQNIFDYNFVDKGLAFLDDDQAAQLQGVAVESDDVLLNITGASVARCCMVPRRHLPARVNQHVMIIRTDSTRMEPSYLLCAINSVEMKRQLLAYAQTGSTREALTREMMLQFAVLLPDQATLRKFGKIAGDIFRQREILADKNANLRNTRDLLLPKLISGELDVSTLPELQAETA